MIGPFLLAMAGSLMMGWSGVELFVNDIEAKKLKKRIVRMERMPYGFRVSLNEDGVRDRGRLVYRGDGTVDVVDEWGELIYAAYSKGEGSSAVVAR